MKKVTKQNPYVIPVRAYFPNTDAGRKLVKRIEQVSKLSGISVSRVATLAIRHGLAHVEKSLVGSGNIFGEEGKP